MIVPLRRRCSRVPLAVALASLALLASPAIAAKKSVFDADPASGQITSTHTVEYDAKRELEVWHDVLKKAQKSAWAPSIQKRIDALEAAGAH